MSQIRISGKKAEVLRQLEIDGRATYTEISKEVGISRTAVKKHVESLISSDSIRVAPLLNAEVFRIRAVMVSAQVRDPRSLKRLVKSLANCPRLIFLGTSNEGKELLALMAAESSRVVECIKEACFISNHRALKVRRITELAIELPKYIRLHIPTKLTEEPPCGVDCSKCVKRNNLKCPGCPATNNYRGSLP